MFQPGTALLDRLLDRPVPEGTDDGLGLLAGVVLGDGDLLARAVLVVDGPRGHGGAGKVEEATAAAGRATGSLKYRVRFSKAS